VATNVKWSLKLVKNWLFGVMALWAVVCGADSGQVTSTLEGPVVRELSEDRYMIGKIEIDRRAGHFNVPAVIIELASAGAPLEFLAIIKDSEKSYESLVGLEANALEFNVACILIGLDAERAVRSRYRFDPRPVAGDPVGIYLSWDQNGERIERSVGELLLLGGKPSVKDDWVYTGSVFDQGVFYAQLSGILIGFVHDPESILQHRQGLGMGEYGAVTYNPAALPPPGTNVTLWVRRLDDPDPS